MIKLIALILSILSSFYCFSQDNLKFRHLSVKDGLSNNNVFCSLQDKHGFIWFGTASGLNRFDGYSFKVFKHIENDSSSLSDNRIQVMQEDLDGRLWIGTSNGLNCFDPITERFQHFFTSYLDSNSLSDNRITALHFSSDRILWVGTENGLNRFDARTSKNIRFVSNLKTQTTQPNKQITSITEDNSGNIWSGMWWGGLKRIQHRTLTIDDFFENSNQQNGFSNNNVLQVFPAQPGFLWIFYYNSNFRKFNLKTFQFSNVDGLTNGISGGVMAQVKPGIIWFSKSAGELVIYNTINKDVRFLKNVFNDPTSVSSGSVRSIFCDKSGIVWVCTDKDVSYYDPNSQKFAPYYHDLNLAQRDYCRSFFQDKSKKLWIDVFGVGLVRYDPITGKSQKINYDPSDSGSLGSRTIHGISETKSGEIWVATDNGISIVDPVSFRVVRKMFYISDHSAALLNTVNANVTCNQSHFFWISTGDSLRIFDVFNQKQWQFSTKDQGALNQTNTTCVIADRSGDLWIGSESFGLYRFQPSTGKLSSFVSKAGDSTSISSNTIHDIFQDRNGFLWLATPNGLNRFDLKLNRAVRYGIKQGLSANECYAVKEDSKGRLWILNSLGLDRFDQSTGRIVKYTELDGIALNSQGFYLTDDNQLVGGNPEKGFYLFSPDSITETKQVLPLYLTDFQIFNESVQIASEKIKSPLNESILFAREITLNHKQSVISLEFAMPDFTSPQKNIYEYTLEGFDNRWFRTDGSRRQITYTNLNSGDYTFRVKSANSDGFWNPNETSLRLRILPPWWKTWWAYTFYTLTIAIILLLIRKYLLDKERLQHIIAIQNIEASKNKELSRLKQQFFTNISHEYRTPLTMISGPVDNLIRNIGQFDRSKISELLLLVQRNANRLLQLTNQLLDVRKLETGHMKPEFSSGDFPDFILKIASGFQSLAEKININFQVVIQPSSGNDYLQWFDADKTEKIISNILSNAFKFTPESGKITLTVRNETKDTELSGEERLYWTISVEDSGIGIPEDELNKVFDRFYQIENTHRRTAEGTGIGLALTKEIVGLLNGTIQVESELGKGSKFTVRLLIDNLKGSENSESEVRIPDPIPENQPQISLVSATDSSGNMQVDEDFPLVLLVEDNADMRQYVSGILNGKYRIHEAENGLQGFEMAVQDIPDLIISDVMMPELDGFELSFRFKNDERTCHIPIILLTSLASSENLIKGLENEADEYITKPFDDRVLLLTVKNLIASRIKLKKMYSALLENPVQQAYSEEIETFESGFSASERKFIDKLMSIMERNLADPDFDVQVFASEIGMESSVFHRKLKAVINQPPGDFIRSTRLKRASQLLTDKSISISEVAHLTGFGNNTNYFSTAFRKHFGISPKAYQNS